MRYRSLIVSAAVLVGVAACRGNDAGMNADLARDLAAAKTSDALALAPHAGEQSVISAAELSPQARARLQSAAASSRSAPHRTPHRSRVTPAVSETSADVSRAAVEEVASVDAPAPAPTPVDPVTTAEPTSSPVYSPHPQPVDVPPPVRTPDAGIGAVLGAIGGVILRGGVVNGDHCDPRGRRSRGGGILINQRGPILRGHFYAPSG